MEDDVRRAGSRRDEPVSMSLTSALLIVWLLIAVALVVRVVTGSEVWSGVALVAGALVVAFWRGLRRAESVDQDDAQI